MKNILIILFILLSFSSCKKDDDLTGCDLYYDMVYSSGEKIDEIDFMVYKGRVKARYLCDDTVELSALVDNVEIYYAVYNQGQLDFGSLAKKMNKGEKMMIYQKSNK